MTFRRPKSANAQSVTEWHAWIDCHRGELAAIGLPAEVYLDEPRWTDFLENGYLEWHESSNFEFSQLSQGQIGALHRFLEQEYGREERAPPLLGWLRVRCGSDRTP
jgi:hypothetical protein